MQEEYRECNKQQWGIDESKPDSPYVRHQLSGSHPEFDGNDPVGEVDELDGVVLCQVLNGALVG